MGDLDDLACRRLIAAVLLQAARDAQRGDLAARDWLTTEGALWADALDIVHPGDVRAWAETVGYVCGHDPNLDRGEPHRAAG